MITASERALIAAFRKVPENVQSMIYQLTISYAASQMAIESLEENIPRRSLMLVASNVAIL